MKSDDRIIMLLGGALILVCVMSFFVTPAYEKGSYFVLGVLASQFANVMGFRFGRSMPQQATDQKPGQTSETNTNTKTDTAPPPPPAA